ncbi:hypothetical protein PG991_012578 [Apiospora marii]|uniref:Uncharacterized protein n=1 Tax=Apiospora marii TaxID=335849 RepID=A0ABR1RB12_9PEZI
MIRAPSHKTQFNFDQPPQTCDLPQHPTYAMAAITDTNRGSMDAARDSPWHGQLPCVCYSHQGCDEHNPGRKALYRNPNLLPKEPRGHERKEPDFLVAFMDDFMADMMFLDQLLSRVLWHLTSTLSTMGPQWVMGNLADGIFRPAREDALRMTRKVESKPTSSPLSFHNENPPFSSDLPFDTGSITTLEPIHDAIPYHLAFYHLDCARRRHKLDSNVKACFIADLSCRGTSTIHPNVPCAWSSEIYYSNGTFLQKQELTYTMDTRRRKWPAVHIRICHHKDVHMHNFEVVDNDGLLAVSLRLTFPPRGRWRDDAGANWRSIWGGNLRNIYVCDLCHSDLEYHVEVVGREVHVRFTCSRDLGAGTERFLPKWHILQTGAGSYCVRNHQYRYDTVGGRCDTPSTYDVYKRVWKTAKDLGRPGLHLATFRTSTGEFSALSN